eukprot:scaffold70882_cov62-Phaeocystis_antarctica.AAC.6
MGAKSTSREIRQESEAHRQRRRVVDLQGDRTRRIDRARAKVERGRDDAAHAEDEVGGGELRLEQEVDRQHLVGHLDADGNLEHVVVDEALAAQQQVLGGVELHPHLEVGPGLHEAHRRDELEVAVQLGRHLELHLQRRLAAVDQHEVVTEEVAEDARAQVDRLPLHVDGNLDALAVDAHLHRGRVGAIGERDLGRGVRRDLARQGEGEDLVILRQQVLRHEQQLGGSLHLGRVRRVHQLDRVRRGQRAVVLDDERQRVPLAQHDAGEVELRGRGGEHHLLAQRPHGHRHRAGLREDGQLELDVLLELRLEPEAEPTRGARRHPSRRRVGELEKGAHLLGQRHLPEHVEGVRDVGQRELEVVRLADVEVLEEEHLGRGEEGGAHPLLATHYLLDKEVGLLPLTRLDHVTLLEDR